MVAHTAIPATFYRHRNPELSPFFRLVDSHFDEFERSYADRYEKQYGFWRPIIRSSIDKFMKCGDLKEGFARIKCKECGHEMFVAFFKAHASMTISCRQRCCCPSCHQKRTLLLAHHLGEDVFAEVPHRQFVFTIPKRLRIYFRYDRTLLSSLIHASWETVREVFLEEVDYEEGFPAMVAGVQTFGDLINFHPHIHAIVPCGIFMESGKFIAVNMVPAERFQAVWEDKVFAFLLKAERIFPEVVENMKSWKHSGFSVDNSVYVAADDTAGMQRLIEYIARCPFSLARIIKISETGKVIYRAGKSGCRAFPEQGNDSLKAGVKRNFEVFEPLDFLAEVTQHIPNKGEHQVRYYGWYSNKQRGVRSKKAEVGEMPQSSIIKKKCSPGWAALIKMIYDVDPLQCPDCGGEMKVVAFIEKCQMDVVEQILRHCNLWTVKIARPPPEFMEKVRSYVPDEAFVPRAQPKVPKSETRPDIDYAFFDNLCG